MRISTPPIASPVDAGGSASRVWATFFNAIYAIAFAVNPSMSSDNGDADLTLTAGKNALTQRFDTTLTAHRTITLSTTGAYTGANFRVVREAGAGGAFNLDVGGLKTLSGASEWADVGYNGSAWILTAYGAL